MEKLRDRRVLAFAGGVLVLYFYFDALAYQANRFLEIIGAVCLIALMLLREAVPEAKRMRVGETVVVLIGFVHAFIVMARDNFFLGVFDVALACVLYAFARGFTHANRAELKEIDELKSQEKAKENEYEIAKAQSDSAFAVWKTYVPAEEERFRAWADQKYHLSEKKAFIESHGVTPTVYRFLSDDMKDVNPRVYEKKRFDDLLAFITARKKEYLKVTNTEQYNRKSMTVSLTNQELLDLMNKKFTVTLIEQDSTKGGTMDLNFPYAPIVVRDVFCNNITKHITSEYLYAADRGYYDDKNALLAEIDMPWSADEDRLEKSAERDIMNALIKQYEQIKAGAEGEAIISNIVDMVSKVDASSQAICGATLTVPGINDLAENDIILVCTKGIYTIEVKNWNGDFIIGDDGIIDRATGEKRKDNPIGQSKYHADVLRKILKGIVSEDAIHPSVFMVNQHCTISAPTATIPVYVYDRGNGVDDLLADIGKSRISIDQDTREKIIRAILSAKTTDRRYNYEIPNYVRLMHKAEYIGTICEFYHNNRMLYYPRLIIELINKVKGKDYSFYPTARSNMLSADDPGHLLPGDYESGLIADGQFNNLLYIRSEYIKAAAEYFKMLADFAEMHVPNSQSGKRA